MRQPEDSPCGTARPPVWEVAARTHVGHLRSANEDSFLCRPELGLFAVADGMGGLLRGDLASRRLVGALAELPPDLRGDALRRAVERAVERVHRDLLDEAVSFGPSGSTIVVLLLEPRRFRVLWAGDSRCGRMREGGLEWLTTDHNLAAALVRRGELPDEEARRHPLASRLTRAVGIDEDFLLDELAGRARPGDLFILCSDGLTGELDDADILAALRAGDPERAADALLAKVLAGAARDNVTFVLVRVPPAEAGGNQG